MPKSILRPDCFKLRMSSIFASSCWKEDTHHNPKPVWPKLHVRRPSILGTKCGAPPSPCRTSKKHPTGPHGSSQIPTSQYIIGIIGPHVTTGYILYIMLQCLIACPHNATIKFSRSGCQASASTKECRSSLAACTFQPSQWINGTQLSLHS